MKNWFLKFQQQSRATNQRLMKKLVAIDDDEGRVIREATIQFPTRKPRNEGSCVPEIKRRG
jgi:hypothetical protein